MNNTSNINPTLASLVSNFTQAGTNLIVGIVTGLQQGIQSLENAVSPATSSSSNDEYDQNDSAFVASQLLSSPVTRPLLRLYNSIIRQQQQLSFPTAGSGFFSSLGPGPAAAAPFNRNPLYNFMYLRPNFRRIVNGNDDDDDHHQLEDDYDHYEVMESDAETDEK